MSENTLFSIGNIIKKEKLISVDTLNKCKALVLEADQPYPGYHGLTLPKEKPDSLYFVIKSPVDDDTIIRAIQKVKQQNNPGFDGAPGTVTITNQENKVIRIKNLHYNDISGLIEQFQKQGFEFAKYKKFDSFESLIKVRKFFKTKEIVDNVYHDLDNPKFFYLQVPVLPGWDNFEEITKKIKYNVEDNNFDAALCSMYNEKGLIDFVRIFDENFKMGKILYIREKYLEAFMNM